MKPRPLSDAQKHDHRGVNTNTTVTTPLLCTFTQQPLYSLLQKSVSDNYLDADAIATSVPGNHGDGKLIGRFPLTLKNGASIHAHAQAMMFERSRDRGRHGDVVVDVAKMKRRSNRPLSMYDNIHHGAYLDSLTTVRYDLV